MVQAAVLLGSHREQWVRLSLAAGVWNCMSMVRPALAKKKEVPKALACLPGIATAENSVFSLPGSLRIKTRRKPANKAEVKEIFGLLAMVKAKPATYFLGMTPKATMIAAVRGKSAFARALATGCELKRRRSQRSWPPCQNSVSSLPGSPTIKMHMKPATKAGVKEIIGLLTTVKARPAAYFLGMAPKATMKAAVRGKSALAEALATGWELKEKEVSGIATAELKRIRFSPCQVPSLYTCMTATPRRGPSTENSD